MRIIETEERSAGRWNWEKATDIRKRKFSLNFVILTILLPKRNILIVINAQVVEEDTISDILTRKQQKD